MKRIVNATTNKVMVKPLSEEEIVKAEQNNAKREAERLAKEQAEAEKQAKLESAKAKLTVLGLDEAEVQAILGL